MKAVTVKNSNIVMAEMESEIPKLTGDQEDPDNHGSTHTLTRPDQRLSEPKFYKVLLLNDDYTPMDFVIHVLKKYFSKTDPEATKVMYQVHNDGAGLAGVFSFEIAETKVYHCNTYAKKNGHPLKCIMEEEKDSQQ
ncbi:ATP-dependent Clp protease adapter ClpS [Bdellovibrionales bacterium]|nr:ATP-dependent Clp protease adapter ClpS [Bdellovibrionales bacterium]